MRSPENEAREKIDALLTWCGNVGDQRLKIAVVIHAEP
jgi:hypothetical protein